MPPRRPARRPLLGLAFGLVLIFLAEVGLRIAGQEPAYRPELLGQWRMSPSLRQRPMKGPRDGHGFLLSTNADGLRTSLPRDPGAPRVALMGDSTVFGWGVDDGGTIADGLAAALGSGVEVLNAGQPGYSTVQAAWLVGELVADYRPDLVVIFVPMHDFNRVLVSDWELLHGGGSVAAKARVALARHSRIYSLLRGWIFTLQDRPFLLPDQADGEPRVARVSDAEREAALREAQAVLAAQGGRLAIGFLPFKADIEGPGVLGERPGLEWARAFTAAEGLGLVDLRGCCRGAGRVLEDDPGHLSATGNLEVGAAAASPVAALLNARAAAPAGAGAPR